MVCSWMLRDPCISLFKGWNEVLFLWNSTTSWLLFPGRVRTKTVKKTAANIVEKYYQKLAMDFDNNKRFAESCDG
ncbi:40S ribosomal protein [Blastocystis sp. subtype 4]|uniref:40S ribosomal protein n=1 Tax=Blastocystis sp. subtype 4 TaxID=944170 RepID=UPI0007120318|nr:40S ribosomal protein [Blastocystis sp. subtype 4]KNB41667.1 40S ribosomal protein [Blastocystis sp. subtype 4]|eukprot:XP_014525110.1 40S ribosomal protein [Blastocystis sp. subtype 4]